MLDRLDLLVRRTWRAWLYKRRLGYSWNLAWAKAGWACGLSR